MVRIIEGVKRTSRPVFYMSFAVRGIMDEILGKSTNAKETDATRFI